MIFERWFVSNPTFRHAVTMTILDCAGHTPFVLIPSFYLITKTIKGYTLPQTLTRLKQEFLVASFGSAAYWAPVQLVNFFYVPQHSKILFVSCLSFFHKTWLSWLSNRQ